MRKQAFSNILIFLILLQLFSVNLFSYFENNLKKDVVIGKDEVYKKEIVTFGGDSLIEGKTLDSIVAFGGSITIRGEVDDDVVGFGSKIAIESRGKVTGSVVCIGGELIKDPESIIEGEIVYLMSKGDVYNYLNKISKGILSFSFVPILFIIKIILLFFWFFIVLFVFVVFQRQVVFSSSELTKHLGRFGAMGFIVFIIFIFLLIFFCILSIILIGLPFLILLIFAYLVIKIFGRTVLLYWIGKNFSVALGWKSASEISCVLVGFVFLMIFSFIPGLSILFTFLLDIFGLGTVLLTRFGTKAYSV
ncbi:MAG: hypothetical protein AB1410_04935 [Acidobacteriota bacterium]